MYRGKIAGRALILVIIGPAVYKQGVPVPSEARQEIKQKAERLTFVSGEMDASAHMAAAVAEATAE